MRVDGDRVVELVTSPPLAAKVRTTPAGPEVMVVGSAASLLEGDALHVELVLGAGARLTVTTVAAQLAHPCPGGGWTAMTVAAEVGPDARLDWRPEPTVVCGGGRHRTTGMVTMAEGAVVTWLEEVVLGRTGEDPRTAVLVSELLVDHGGVPLLRDGLDTTLPGAHGPAGLGAGVRYVGTRHHWGEAPAVAPSPTAAGVTFALAGAGSAHRVVATDPAAGRTALAIDVGLAAATG